MEPIGADVGLGLTAAVGLFVGAAGVSVMFGRMIMVGLFVEAGASVVLGLTAMVGLFVEIGATGAVFGLTGAGVVSGLTVTAGCIGLL